MLITHLVFSGGNIRGLVFLGVIRYLYGFNMMKDVKNVGGTSFGAVIATLIAIRVPIEQLEKQFVDFSNDEDIKLTDAANIHNIFTKLGIDSARKYVANIISYLKTNHDKEDLTFQEVSKKFGINLYINAFCVNTQKDMVFNIDTTPDVPIIDALVASISLPLISQPVLIDGMHYCDSFFVNNIMSEFFKDIPEDNKLIVISSVPYDCPQIDKDGTMDALTYYSIISITCLNSVFEYSCKRHINSNTLLFNERYPILDVKITNKGLLHDVDQPRLESAILYGFFKTSEYFCKRLSNKQEQS